MEVFLPFLKLAAYLAIALGACWIFLKFCQWVNRAQVKKWEGAVEDSTKSVHLQEEILVELKAIRQMLESRDS